MIDPAEETGAARVATEPARSLTLPGYISRPGVNISVSSRARRCVAVAGRDSFPGREARWRSRYTLEASHGSGSASLRQLPGVTSRRAARTARIARRGRPRAPPQ